ncbi:AMP-binding protein [Amycolatopsis keratiniphila]|uniref:AMP-binding protein n=1 Tax=Amycolatopsis keratiniphila TaxID=129921 RepID=UPI0033CF9495
MFPEPGVTITRPVLAERANGLGRELLATGTDPGDVVGILMPSAPSFPPALLGILTTGAAASVLPLPTTARDPDAMADDLAAYIRAAGIRQLVTAAPFTGLLAPLLDRCPELRVLDADRCGTASRRPTSTTVRTHDPALVQFTSGSTARPRGVVLSHGAVLNAALAPIRRCDFTPADVGYQWLPLFHDFGMIGLIISLCAGFDIHLANPATFIRDQERALRYFSENGVTVCTGPNFAYDRLLSTAECRDLSDVDLSRWRIALTGGEQVAATTVRRFTEILGRQGLPGAAMTPAYGMAEYCAGITIGAPDRAPRIVTVDRASLVPGNRVRVCTDGWDLVAQGSPLDGTEIRVVGSGGSAVPTGCFGEIEVRGASLMNGYLNDPVATSKAVRDGWLRTGDEGFVLGGELYVAGRSKDMVIVRGRNVHAEDVEAMVRQVPGVYQRHCVAVADKRREQLTVVVESTMPDRESVAEKVRQEIAERLGLAQVVVHVVDRSWLPRTTSGKWRRAEIRRRVETGELGA